MCYLLSAHIADSHTIVNAVFSSSISPGHYYNKRFYVWLESDTVTKQLRVFKHTLPYFVPIKQLEEQHLVKNVRVSLLDSMLFLYHYD